jgi:acyl-CoA synthetase (AMP-forming)/AMP-acid ligase II
MQTNPFLTYLQENEAQIAVIERNGYAIQCGALYQKSSALAANLKAKGAKAGQKMVIACEPGVDFLCILYAAMQLEWQVAIIDPEMGRDNYKAKLAQLQPDWAFIDYRLLLIQENPLLRAAYLYFSKKGIYLPYQKGLNVVATGRWLPIFQPHFSLKNLCKTPANPASTATNGEDYPFMITYTSGTLAEPKGVVHTMSGLSHSLNLLSEVLRSDTPQRLATHLPHFMLIGIQVGVPVYLWNDQANAAEKIRFIERHKITTLFGPPSDYLPLMDYCRTQGRKLPACLTHVLFGSAPVHVAFLEKIHQLLPEHCRSTMLYGMTEHLVTTIADGVTKMNRKLEGDWLGFPAPTVEMRVEAEEFCVRSPQLFQGYFLQQPRDVWHPTGDLGRIEADGSVTLTGRKKDMLIRGNFNIYPALYEPTINRMPGVADCALIGIYDESIHDERVILFIEPEPNATVQPEQWMKWLTQGAYAIDKPALPDEIRTTTLPRKGRQNKIDRVQLRTQG